MNVSRDFEEFFALLNEYDVRYLVVGGYAFAIHACPRYTDDLHIFFARDEENARKLLAVLRAFGFTTDQLTVEDLLTENKIIQMGLPPFRIDLLTSIDGITFPEAWPNRVESQYGTQIAFFIGKADLIKAQEGTKYRLQRIQ